MIRFSRGLNVIIIWSLFFTAVCYGQICSDDCTLHLQNTKNSDFLKPLNKEIVFQSKNKDWILFGSNTELIKSRILELAKTFQKSINLVNLDWNFPIIIQSIFPKQYEKLTNIIINGESVAGKLPGYNCANVVFIANDYSSYRSYVSNQEFVYYLKNYCQNVDEENIVPGDIGVKWIVKDQKFRHTFLILGEDLIFEKRGRSKDALYEFSVEDPLERNVDFYRCHYGSKKMNDCSSQVKQFFLKSDEFENYTDLLIRNLEYSYQDADEKFKEIAEYRKKIGTWLNENKSSQCYRSTYEIYLRMQSLEEAWRSTISIEYYKKISNKGSRSTF